MRIRAGVFATAVLFVVAVACGDQEVRVQRLEARAKEAARTGFERALASRTAVAKGKVLGDLAICGPRLWQTLRGKVRTDTNHLVVAHVFFDGAERAAAWGLVPADVDALPDDKRQAMAKLQENSGRIVIETGLVQEENRNILGQELAASWSNTGQKPVRDATDAEMGYMWALVPYDLEEPIFVIETSDTRFLVNLDRKGRVVWVDLLPTGL